MRKAIPLLFLLVAMPLLAQTAADEKEVLATALDWQFNSSMGYVQHWVVNPATEPLAPCDKPREACEKGRADYIERNKAASDLSGLSVVKRAEFGDLTPFVKDNAFDWAAFEDKYGAETWTARVARPGFSDATHAVVRMDVWAREKEVPPFPVALFVAKQNGQWKIVGGTNPATSSWHR